MSKGNVTFINGTEANSGCRKAHKVQDYDTRDQALHPESHLWLGLGNNSTLVKVREILWSRLNVIKYAGFRVSSHFGL